MATGPTNELKHFVADAAHLWGWLAAALSTVFAYIFGRRKREADSAKTEAEAAKIMAEAEAVASHECNAAVQVLIAGFKQQVEHLTELLDKEREYAQTKIAALERQLEAHQKEIVELRKALDRRGREEGSIR